MLGLSGGDIRSAAGQIRALGRAAEVHGTIGGPWRVIVDHGPYVLGKLSEAGSMVRMSRKSSGRSGPVSGAVPLTAWMWRCGSEAFPELPAKPRKSPALTVAPTPPLRMSLFSEPFCMCA